MASRNKPSAFTAEQVEDQSETNSEDEVVVAEPVTVMSADSDYVNARVKGTWKMFWGSDSFDFVDGGMGSLNYSTAVWDKNSKSSFKISSTPPCRFPSTHII